VVIFDCNGVLVDSEPIVSDVLSAALTRAGFPLSTETVARRFHGRRQADIFAAVEAAAGRKLPTEFETSVAAETLRRFRRELKALPHVVHALTWLRGPKAVASSSSRERIRISLQITGLQRFFGARLFSAADVAQGKPAPDLFLHTAAALCVEPAECVVVEDSPRGVAAAVAAGMIPIGFVGGGNAAGGLAAALASAGAAAVIADMRELKSTVAELRGW